MTTTNEGMFTCRVLEIMLPDSKYVLSTIWHLGTSAVFILNLVYEQQYLSMCTQTACAKDFEMKDFLEVQCMHMKKSKEETI